MGSWSVTFLAVMLCLQASGVLSNWNYLIMAPKEIRPGRPLDLQVSVVRTNGGRPVDIVAGIRSRKYNRETRSQDEKVEVQESFSMTAGSDKIVSLMMPSDMTYGSYYLFVNGTGGLTFNNDTYITFKDKTESVFVQTDKGIYKPGQAVKFRVLAMFADLKTLRSPFDIVIKDPHGTMMKQWLRQDGVKGVVSKEFQLIEETSLGEWIIDVKYKEKSIQKTFTVDEYVLPKFEVSAKLPSFTTVKLLAADGLKGFIQAKYTYGQPVVGKVKAVIQIKPQPYQLTRYSWQNYDWVFTQHSISGELKDGKLDFHLTPEDLSRLKADTIYDNQKMDEEDGSAGPEGPGPRGRRSIQKRQAPAPEGPGSGPGGAPRGAPGGSDGGAPTGSETGYDLTHLNKQTLLVAASVVETLTGIELASNSTLYVDPKEYRLKFLEATPSSFKEGLTFTGFLQLSRADGSPPQLTDLNNNQMNLSHRFEEYETVNYPYPHEELVTAKTIKESLPVDPSGLVVFSVRVPLQSFSKFKIRAMWQPPRETYPLEESEHVSRFESLTDQGIQISMDNNEGSLKAGQTVTFRVEATEVITGYYYILMSKGLIVRQDHIQLPSSSANSTFEVAITADLARQLAPTGRVLVWYFKGSETAMSSEIIVDSVSFNVDGIFANKVSLAFSTNQTKPGRDVDLTVKADPESYVGLMAVDKSVLLLDSGNDLTTDMIEDELRQYDSSNMYRPRYLSRRKRSIAYCYGCYPSYVGGQDATQVLSNAGVIVFTDGYIHSYQSKSAETTTYMPTTIPTFPTTTTTMRPMTTTAAGPAGPAGSAGPEGDRGEAGPELPTDGGDKESGLEDPGPPRQEFPETWLWMDQMTGPDGQVVQSVKAPDTITSWVASAFAVNDESGIGVASEAAKLNVFMPFFLSLTLPYSAVRGEELRVLLTVFNYMAEEQMAMVTVVESPDFEFRWENDLEGKQQTLTMDVTVAAGNGETVVFWARPVTVGNNVLEVRGQSTTAADAVQRILPVEPEGVEQIKTQSVLIDLSDGQPNTYEFDIEVPMEGLVEGSEYISMVAVGDIMGQSIENVKQLVRMPYGCGEQNMINFAPNVYVMQYLTAIHQLTPTIKDNAIRFMEAGYQREMTYQRNDGSFSAFGNSDKAGSMWLTSFVVRIFGQSRAYIEEAIDVKEGIVKSSRWIMQGQSRDGSFPEIGNLHHKAMQGGASSGVTLTAYVLTSLLENKDLLKEHSEQLSRYNVNVETSINNAIEFLVNHIDRIKDMPYALSIVTYALTMADSDEAAETLTLLEGMTTTESGKTFLECGPPECGVNSYHKASASDIEINSYLLLTYAAMQDVGKALPVLRFLTGNQNDYGGYHSTQDTILALEGMANFGALFGTSDAQRVSLTVNDETDVYDMPLITSENSRITHIQELSKTAKHITLEATGQGVAIVQLVVKYYTQKKLIDDGVKIWVHAIDQPDDYIEINACAWWLGEDDSGMGIINIDLPTGTSLQNKNEILEQKTLHGKGKRIEVSGKRTSVYVDEFTEREMCIKLNVKRDIPVNNLQDSKAEAVVYYDPDKKDTVLYGVGNQTDGVTGPPYISRKPTSTTEKPRLSSTPKQVSDGVESSTRDMRTTDGVKPSSTEGAKPEPSGSASPKPQSSSPEGPTPTSTMGGRTTIGGPEVCSGPNCGAASFVQLNALLALLCAIMYFLK